MSKKRKGKTQHQRILEFLEEHGEFTYGDLLGTLRINGANMRVKELRDAGYEIIGQKKHEGDNFLTFTRGADQFNNWLEDTEEEYTREDYEADEFDYAWHAGDYAVAKKTEIFNN